MMAGSYQHVTNPDGTYRGMGCIDNLGDASEAIEEMWQMIHALTNGSPWSIYLAWLEATKPPGAQTIDPTEEDYAQFWE